MKNFLIVVMVPLIALSGCSGRRKRTVGREEVPVKGEISKAEIEDELNRFEHQFISEMKRVAEEIDAASQTRRTKRVTAQMQMKISEALHAMSASDDAIVAFLDTWGLVARLGFYLKEGAGKSLHGDQQAEVIAFIDNAEEEMERIGQLFLVPKAFDELKKSIFRFARQHSVEGIYSNLIVYATQEEKEKVTILAQTLRIPMAPIRALEGVDNTAVSIHEVSRSVDQFTEAASQIPETVRWQMSMLMEDFEESEMTQSFLKSLDDFSQSSTQLVKILDDMPEQLRTELLTILKESDESQQQLQTTMQTAMEASAHVKKMLAQIDTTSQTLNVTVQQASEAAAAWKNASDSIRELAGMFVSDEPKDPNAPPGFGMQDFDAMLLHAGQAADKVGAAVAQIHQTVNTAAETEIPQQLRSLIDHIVWRLFELVLAILILIWGSRFVMKKLKTSASK